MKVILPRLRAVAYGTSLNPFMSSLSRFYVGRGGISRHASSRKAYPFLTLYAKAYDWQRLSEDSYIAGASPAALHLWRSWVLGKPTLSVKQVSKRLCRSKSYLRHCTNVAQTEDESAAV